MTEAKDHCFVLWADRFDEVAAVVFVAELRRAGLWVKLVGLPGPSFVGRHGLALTPDLTLDEALALAERVACIVVPCDSPAMQRVVNDPRLAELLEQAEAGRAQIVAGQAASAALEQVGASQRAGMTVYSQGRSFYRQARRLARQVAGESGPAPLARLRLGWQGA